MRTVPCVNSVKSLLHFFTASAWVFNAPPTECSGELGKMLNIGCDGKLPMMPLVLDQKHNVIFMPQCYYDRVVNTHFAETYS